MSAETLPEAKRLSATMAHIEVPGAFATRPPESPPHTYNLPSKLGDPAIPYDTTAIRMRTIQTSADALGIPVREEYAGDEQYWREVSLGLTHNIISLRHHFPDAPKQQLQRAALDLAVRNSEQLMRVEQEGATDKLTGTWNRGALDNYLKNLIKNSSKVPHDRRREADDISVLFVDIDHFKRINDEKGHAEGDKKLQELVQILSAQTRPTDMVGRYGGEEFVVVVPQMTPEKAIEKSEALRERIQREMGLTVSIGITSINEDDTDIDAVYARADAGVYAAKDRGRNRSVAHVGFTPDRKSILTDLSNGIRYVEYRIEEGGTEKRKYIELAPDSKLLFAARP